MLAIRWGYITQIGGAHKRREFLLRYRYRRQRQARQEAMAGNFNANVEVIAVAGGLVVRYVARGLARLSQPHARAVLRAIILRWQAGRRWGTGVGTDGPGMPARPCLIFVVPKENVKCDGAADLFDRNLTV